MVNMISKLDMANIYGKIFLYMVNIYGKIFLDMVNIF